MSQIYNSTTILVKTEIIAKVTQITQKNNTSSRHRQNKNISQYQCVDGVIFLAQKSQKVVQQPIIRS